MKRENIGFAVVEQVTDHQQVNVNVKIKGQNKLCSDRWRLEEGSHDIEVKRLTESQERVSES